MRKLKKRSKSPESPESDIAKKRIEIGNRVKKEIQESKSPRKRIPKRPVQNPRSKRPVKTKNSKNLRPPSVDKPSKVNKKKPQSRPQRPRIVKKYRKQRCAFVSEGGTQCGSNAVGKSTLCKKHGGSPVIKENLIPAVQESKEIIGLVTKYDPAVHPVSFIDYSRMGLSDIEIAAQFEVSVETLRGWAEKYEMFNTAFDIGKAMHETWWLEQGKSGLNNRGFNTSLFKFLTSNKLGYSDKMETKNMNMNVHGVLMVPDRMSEDEWEKDDVIDADS